MIASPHLVRSTTLQRWGEYANKNVPKLFAKFSKDSFEDPRFRKRNRDNPVKCCENSIVVVHLLPKQGARVRFPLLAHF